MSEENASKHSGILVSEKGKSEKKSVHIRFNPKKYIRSSPTRATSYPQQVKTFYIIGEAITGELTSEEVEEYEQTQYSPSILRWKYKNVWNLQEQDPLEKPAVLQHHGEDVFGVRQTAVACKVSRVCNPAYVANMGIGLIEMELRKMLVVSNQGFDMEIYHPLNWALELVGISETYNSMKHVFLQ
jgi:hypothetical protein